MINYSLQATDTEINFYCDDKETIEHIADYISRYIDAQNWRNMFYKTEKVYALYEEEE